MKRQRPLPLFLAVARWMLLALAFLGPAGCEPRTIERDPAERLIEATQAEVTYRRVQLANGLKVMLISDPAADRSAAAMAVAAGSLEDPADRPGMAHFLEHMLFLGTEKYPRPGGYQQYLSSHAGYSNAYTSDDHTNYFFQVAHPAFPEALDRFAQFFTAPLFNASYVEREVNAVAAEHSKNVDSDMWRVQQIMRDMFLSSHPISRFSTGSLETLGDVGRRELMTFYESHYSANLMTLAVLGSQDLDTLEGLVRERFGSLRNRNLARPSYPATILERKAALRLVTVEPVADQRGMIVEFPLPPTRQHYKVKPGQMLAFLLGHEGRGSLLSLLKAENLASSLSAGLGEETADYATLTLRFGLTPEGLARYEDILNYLFGAIRYYRTAGLPRYIFEENRVMAELNFRYQPKPESGRRVSHLSAMMQAIPMEELPEAAFKYEIYDPGLVRQYLDELRPDNMLVTLIAKGVPTDRVEPYYRARYGYREITGKVYERLVASRPDRRIHLPERNPFIPHVAEPGRPDGPLKLAHTTFLYLEREGVPRAVLERLQPLRNVTFTNLDAFMKGMAQVLPEDERERYEPLILNASHPIPVRLLDNARGKVWFLPDWRFRQPKAHIILKFRTGTTYASPRQAVLARLYQEGVSEALNEFGYPVRLAGLDYSIEAEKTGIVLTLSGYSPRMLELLGHLADRLHRVGIGEAAFASIKERFQRTLQNERFAQPYRQAAYYRELLLEEPTFPREALEKELGSVTLREVQEYASHLFEHVYLEGAVAGDLDPAAVRFALFRMLLRLGSQPLPEAERIDERVRVLPRGADYVYTRRLEVNNSLIDLAYQVGQSDPTLRGGLLIIGRALRDSFYFNMRTQQQLGYIVFSGMGQMKKTLSLNFLLQSGAYPADILMERVETYIPEFVKEFKSLPDKAFERLRAAVIDAKLKRDSNIQEVANRLNWIAFENDEKFDHVSEDIRAVERLTREEVERILEHALLGRGAKRLLIRLVGKEHSVGRPHGTPIEAPSEIRAEAG